MTEQPNNQDIVVQDVVSAESLGILTKSELEVQVSVARKYPRSIAQFKADAMNYATVDEVVAGLCIYAVPRAGGAIQGPSIRLAEILASAWGNLRLVRREIAQDDQWVTCQGVAWDAEKNNICCVEQKRRIVDKYGKKYSVDMIQMTSAACASIALRNAIFTIIPRSLVMQVYEAAKRVVTGDAASLLKKRGETIHWFRTQGISDDALFSHIGISGLDDMNWDHVLYLNSAAREIKAGNVRMDQFLAPRGDEQEEVKPGAAIGALKQRLRDTVASTKNPAGVAPPELKTESRQVADQAIEDFKSKTVAPVEAGDGSFDPDAPTGDLIPGATKKRKGHGE